MRVKFLVQKYLCVAVLLLFFMMPAEGANPRVVISDTGQFLLDLNVAYHMKNIVPNREEQLREVFKYLADALYEATNSKFLLRNVNIYLGRTTGAHINWVKKAHPCANINGYSTGIGNIEACDIFDNNLFVNDENPMFDARKQGNANSGYTLAHELGHYLFGLFDEYVGNEEYPDDPSMPRRGDVEPMGLSIMNDQWAALEENNFAALNFSTSLNYSGQLRKKNAQTRMFDASAWETLVVPSGKTPKYNPKPDDETLTRVQYFFPTSDSKHIPTPKDGKLDPMDDYIIDLAHKPLDYKHAIIAQAGLKINFYPSVRGNETMRVVVNNSSPQNAKIGEMAAAKLLDSVHGGSFDVIAFNADGKPELIVSGAANTSADKEALRAELQSNLKPVPVSVNIDDAVAFANPDTHDVEVVVVSGTLPSNKNIYVISTNNAPPAKSEEYTKYYTVYKEESDHSAIFGAAFDIANDVYYETDEVFYDEFLIAPNGKGNVSFRADEAKNGMRIAIGFEGVSADLGITLTDPDGVVVREDEFYSYESDGMFFRELDSEAFAGSWTIDAINSLAAEKLVFVSVSALIDDDAQARYSLEVVSSRRANTAAVAIDAPEVINVMLYKDNDLLAGAGEIEGTVFDGTESRKIIFLDNGNPENGDARADDGIYSALVKFKGGTHTISAMVKLDDATLRVSTINNFYAVSRSVTGNDRPPLLGDEFKASFSRTGMMTVIADKTVAPIERKSSGCNAGNFTPFALILLLFLSNKFTKFKK